MIVVAGKKQKTGQIAGIAQRPAADRPAGTSLTVYDHGRSILRNAWVRKLKNQPYCWREWGLPRCSIQTSPALRNRYWIRHGALSMPPMTFGIGGPSKPVAGLSTPACAAKRPPKPT